MEEGRAGSEDCSIAHGLVVLCTEPVEDCFEHIDLVMLGTVYGRSKEVITCSHEGGVLYWYL